MNIDKRLVLLALTGVTLTCSTETFSMTRFTGVSMSAKPAHLTIIRAIRNRWLA